MDTTLRERVKCGAALLDKEKPGWRERIVARRLDSSNTCNCVLGQVYGEYLTGLSILYPGQDIYETEDWQEGFDVEWGTSHTDLTDEWRRFLTED